MPVASKTRGNMKIDSEFKALIPPPSAEELEQLEQLILQEGRARHALCVLNAIPPDGHNRHAICEKHRLPYELVEVAAIKDRTDAKIWIIRNQFGRRNLSPFARA